ncbi:MAG: hypothetical protein HDT22_10480 [Ruminococcus sp.]|nr:hypothetical protein [Ruminococcus sp.]
MKKKNLIVLALAFILLFLPNVTTYATTYTTKLSDVTTYEYETINHLIYDYNVRIYPYAPYTSKIFSPNTNRVSIIFGSWGTRGTSYTYYLEERNANGTWTVINSHTLNGGGSISTSAYVTPNNLYRVRATTTDTSGNGMYLEVYEYIYN